MNARAHTDSKAKLLDAALHVIRAKGYTATTVDDICAEAGVTKGSFFHHFESKEALALGAADHFSSMADRIFGAAPYRAAKDPLDRILGYIDFRAAILTGEIPDYTCLLGTMVQEVYETHPAIREACERGMSSHIADLTKDIEEAKKLHAPDAPWSAESVGYFIQSVLQGSFVYAKATRGPEVARRNLDHARAYIQALFQPPLCESGSHTITNSKRKKRHD